jgi:hypothetical protein
MLLLGFFDVGKRPLFSAEWVVSEPLQISRWLRRVLGLS